MLMLLSNRDPAQNRISAPACPDHVGDPVRVNATGTRDTRATFRKGENSEVFNIGHSWRPGLWHVYGVRGGAEICGIISWAKQKVPFETLCTTADG